MERKNNDEYINLTPFCFVIADWSGDFCRTLAWSIFDDSDNESSEEKAESSTIRRSIEGLSEVRKDNYICFAKRI